jgi:hypothetical protein
MTWEEACRLMGIAETATQAEIKDQYLYKVQLLHPDKNLNKPEKVVQRAGEELALVNEAYKFLCEPKNDPNNQPKLEVTPKYIRFGEMGLGQKKSTTIEIKNAGGPFSNIWVDNSPSPWLTITVIKAAGTEPLPLTVTIEAQGLPEIIQSETCSLVIKLKNEKTRLSDEAAIVVEITPQPLAAKLKIRPGKMTFREIPPGSAITQALEIKNSGTNNLHGFIITKPPWLSVSQKTINLPRRSLSRNYLVQVDASALGPRFSGRGSVEVFTNGGSVIIPVEVSTAAQPQWAGAPATSYYPASKPATGSPVAPPASQTAYPSYGKKKGWSSFSRFLFIYAVTFLTGFGVVYLFTANRPEGLDWGSVRGWAILTFVVSLLVAAMRC